VELIGHFGCKASIGIPTDPRAISITEGRQPVRITSRGRRRPLRRLLCVLSTGLLAIVAIPLSAEGAAGPWTIATSPDAGGQTDNFLTGVSCESAGFCVAVGYYGAAPGFKPLIEASDHGDWILLTSPDPGANTLDDILSGVSCVSPSFCAAVGSYVNSTGATEPLVEMWDGNGWTVTPTPDSGGSSSLEGVACGSATRCTAVGGTIIGGSSSPLIESWDGERWSIVPTPTVGSSSSLRSVSCASTTSCVAVGGNLIESWDGQRWSTVERLVNSTGSDSLASVSCTSARACTAVGETNGNGNLETLVEIWNGDSWSTTASVDPGTKSNSLSGVSCSVNARCVAVGWSLDSDGTQRALLESLSDGAASALSAPPGGSGAFLSGVSCISSGYCAAVGSSLSPDLVYQTLVEATDRP
jgi:hypothetical protein